jgi:hypothetical protein
MSPSQKTLTASCACGAVEFEAVGEPILCAVCYCDDCQAAARQIEALPHAGPVMDADGGSDFVLYRKDRYRCLKGAEQLKSHKLDAKSPTKRVYAACCNSALYLGFDDAKHWVSAYRGRFQGPVPPVQARIQTRFRPAAGALPSDAPSYAGFPPAMLFKVLGARIAMLFGH